MPFAIVGSEEEIEIEGQAVRARIYPWGIVEVDNPQHSDFSRLRGALLGYVLEFHTDVVLTSMKAHIFLISRR